jgi:hypothetical protein
MNEQFKHAVTIAEMARMVGLSRSRFYQLIGKAFPEPSRDESGKPFYAEEQQQMILDVRRRNCGINGKPILFYAPRHSAPAPIKKRRPKNIEIQDGHAAITEGVKALGLPMVTVVQVSETIKQLFPNGIDGITPGEVIKQVFLSLKRQNSSDNVGR